MSARNPRSDLLAALASLTCGVVLFTAGMIFGQETKPDTIVVQQRPAVTKAAPRCKQATIYAEHSADADGL